MKKFFTLFSFLALCGLFTLSAQPNMTLWQIDEAHLADHTQGQADLWPCGTGYYYAYEAPGVIHEIIIDILNDGDEDLIIPENLSFTTADGSSILGINSGPEWAITEQPGPTVLAPGEEAHFRVAYTSPATYASSVAAIEIPTNDPDQPNCVIFFEVGNAPNRPANDNCDGAITLECNQPVDGTLIGARTDVVRCNFFLPTFPVANAVWYKFIYTPGTTINLTSDFPIVFPASLGLLVGGGGNSCSFPFPDMCAPPSFGSPFAGSYNLDGLGFVPGQEYFIMVGGIIPQNFSIEISRTPPSGIIYNDGPVCEDEVPNILFQADAASATGYYDVTVRWPDDVQNGIEQTQTVWWNASFFWTLSGFWQLPTGSHTFTLVSIHDQTTGCTSYPNTTTTIDVLPKPDLATQGKTLCSLEELGASNPTAQLYTSPSFGSINNSLRDGISASLDFFIMSVTTSDPAVVQINTPGYVVDPAMNDANAVNGMAIRPDAWSNPTDALQTVTYTVAPRITYTVDGVPHICKGEAEDIVYTILPEPQLATQDKIVCSNETLGANTPPPAQLFTSPTFNTIRGNLAQGDDASLDFFITAVVTSDPAVTQVNTPAYVVDPAMDDANAVGGMAIKDDAWNNPTAALQTVTYTVVPRITYTINGQVYPCKGVAEDIVYTILPEPQLATQGDELCSDVTFESAEPPTAQLYVDPSYINEIVPNLPQGASATLGFFIMSITPEAGLTRSGGTSGDFVDPNMAEENLVNGMAIKADSWTNQTTDFLTVTYTIVARIVYTINGREYPCKGEPTDVVFTIKPEPVLVPVDPVTLCSDSENPAGGFFGTGITLAVDNDPAAGNQPPAGAAISYRLDEVVGEEVLADPGAANTAVGTEGDASLIFNDDYINTTMAPVVVTYTITPLATYNAGTPDECICEGDPVEVKVVVMPKPSVDVTMDIVGVDYPTSGTCGNFDVIMDVTVCNDGPVKVKNLNVDVDLTDQSNGIFVGNVQVLGIVDGVDLSADLNAGYDGQGDGVDENTADEGAISGDDLFAASTGSLDKTECTVIRIRWEVAPENAASEAAASAATFAAEALAQGDWSDLAQTDPNFDASIVCYSDTDNGEEVLGDCWDRTRDMGANDQINITTLNVCEGVVTPDMILENHFGDCDTGQEYPLGGFYRVRVLYPGQLEPDTPELSKEISAEDFLNGNLIVYIENVGNFCKPVWGEINLEDKIDPYVVNCPEDVDWGVTLRPVQYLNPNDVEGYGLLDINNYSCFIEDGAGGLPQGAPVPYATMTFNADKTDVYTFELKFVDTDLNDLLAGADARGIMALFQGDFNPDEPCSNIIGQNGNIIPGFPATGPGIDDLLGLATLIDVDVEGRLRLTLPLQEDQEYTLFVSLRGAEDGHPFLAPEYGYVLAYSDGDGEIYDEEEGDIDVIEAYPIVRRLMCSDVPYILDKDPYDAAGALLDLEEGGYFIPFPLFADNCDEEVEYTFEDELVEAGDCGEIYIRRTWTSIKDDSGNEVEDVCEQIIHFRRPGLHNVFRPAKTVPIECDELSAEFLDENGHPAPSVTGYPFVVSLFGIHDLNEAYCNIGADYQDISVIDVCDNTQKIIRQWTILDWCDVPGQEPLNNAPAINYRQIIKWGDFSAPEVEIKNPNSVVAAGPFSCAGNLLISDLEVDDNCSATHTADVTVYELVEVPILDKYGRETGETEIVASVFASGLTEGSIVTGVVQGNTYKVHYDVADACGNTTIVSYEVTIRDYVEPVAVCDDDLHISIGGEGIGRVTAEDVDEGSWDNCELLDLHVSRKLVDEATRDAYLDEVYSLTFGDLVKASNIYGRLYDWDKSSDADIWVVDEDGDGEWDEGEDHRVLRYKDGMYFTWWRDDIWFLCIDMGLEVTIELLARDIYYNTNICWLDVLIEDKVAPYCYAPDDVDIDCTDLPYGFDPEDDDQLAALFGVATATDNCAATAELVKSEVKYWECNSGKIVRYFSATDDKGTASLNTCKQTIIVNRVHEYEIKFPKDASADCESPIVDTIVTKEIACDLLSVNVYDERFEASGDACYKIKRTYKVINWCEYDGESEAIVVNRDHDCNGITGDEDIWVLVRPDSKGSKGDDDSHPDVYYDRNGDETDEDPEEYERGCSPENPDGYWEKDTQFGNYHYDIHGNEATSVGFWQYSQFIKVYDTTPPTITAPDVDDICSIANDCSADVSIDITVDDFCAGDDVVVKVFLLPDAATGLPESVDLQVAANAALVNFQLTATHPNYTLSGRFPLGDHAFEVHAVDGCQNSEIALIPFSVVDCKAPTPICINGLAVELMPTEDGGGMMDIWASDFQVSGLEDCSGIEGLYITKDADGDDAEKSAELILTCDDPDTLAVRIWAVDNAGNEDYCLTYVLVQDNMFDLCDPAGPAAISGLITDESNQTVENAKINLSGGMEATMTTTVDGAYIFNGLTSGTDYTITPALDEDYLNGVSTFDLVLITKHILGTKKLDSPYKMIAADANRSNNITALDLIQLRKLVLSVNRELAANTSWRFVPASYNFPDPTNPWAEVFPEVLNYNDLQTAITTGDFFAIKIGDVNANAAPNSTVAEQRNLVGQFHLNVEDQTLVAGNEYRVSFTAPIADLQGYQFTLNYEGLELMDIEYGVAQAEHFGVIEDGVLTTSWNGEATTNELFTLIVRANVDAQLSDLLSVSSRYTQAEAYNTADELMGVALAFNGSMVREGYELYQNQPNPFAERTMIGFSLPQAANATIRISDVTGKTLKLIRGDYAKGYNQINLNSRELSSGVLYYTLETGDFTATKKMVLIGE